MFEHTIASTKGEVLSALHLVYCAYKNIGLIDSNEKEIRILKYHTLPNTDVLITKKDGKIMYTMTLIGDSEHLLPSDKIYSDILNRLREENNKLVEVSSLAGTNGFSIFRYLCRFSVGFSKCMGYNNMVVSVHPHHVPFYNRMFAFKKIADERVYEDVNNNPAVLLSLDLNNLHNLPEKLYKFWKKFDYSCEDILSKRMTDNIKQELKEYLI